MVVDLDGALVDAPLLPTTELPLHLAVYRNFDAGAVVHTHPPMATAVACVADELPCIHYTQLSLGGSVRVAPYVTFGTEELAAAWSRPAGTTAALMGEPRRRHLRRGHRAAMAATELLEWACGVYVTRAPAAPRACSTSRSAARSPRRWPRTAFPSASRPPRCRSDSGAAEPSPSPSPAPSPGLRLRPRLLALGGLRRAQRPAHHRPRAARADRHDPQPVAARQRRHPRDAVAPVRQRPQAA